MNISHHSTQWINRLTVYGAVKQANEKGAKGRYTAALPTVYTAWN